MIDAHLGGLVRRLRKEAGLTQETLAERALLSVRTVSDIESGAQRRPRPDTLEAIAEALGLDAVRRAGLYDAVPRSESARAPVMVRVPEPPVPLHGRDADLDAIAELLATPGVRFVTLTGIGGVGKTSLAFEAARRHERERAATAVLAEVAAIDAPELVLPVIGQSLAQQSGSNFIETIADAVGTRPTLLVVDSLEHVRAAAADLARIVSAVPSLTILATSRFALGLRMERIYAVSPLRLDDAAGLFVDRVRATYPGFGADASDPDVRAVVEQLDRLPLAIELAAPRVKVLGTAGLREALSERLGLLTSDDADRPARQRTMRDTVAWSYGLLDDDDRLFFRHISVFRGGFRLDGARELCRDAVVDRVQSLLDKQLLRRCERDGEPPRFGMLETIAEFARERARESAEWEELSRAHALYMARFAEQLETDLAGDDNHASLRRADEEIDNIRAATTWCSETNDVGTALRISAALWRYWLLRDMPEEARWRLRTFLERYENGAAVPVEIAAKAYCNAASFEFAAGGESARVHRYALASAALYVQLGDADHARRIRDLVEAL